MSRIIEGGSHDEHSHSVAGDSEGLLLLSDTIEAALQHASPQRILLQPSNLTGFRPEDLRLSGICVQRTDGLVLFRVVDRELRIEGGGKALASLALSINTLASQVQLPGNSSPRYDPRWYEGNDLLERSSDELNFYQLPVD